MMLSRSRAAGGGGRRSSRRRRGGRGPWGAAGGAGDGDDAGVDTGIGAGVGEGFAVKGGGEVVAEFADVAGAEAPVLAGDDGGGDLSARKSADGGVFGLGAALGVGGERDDR